MKQVFAAQQLTIYIGEEDQWHGKPLHAAIIEHLRSKGIAGVTVLKGVEGFGSHGVLHSSRVELLFEGLPLLIEAVDKPEKVAAVLASLEEMLTEALVTVFDVQATLFSRSAAS